MHHQQAEPSWLGNQAAPLAGACAPKWPRRGPRCLLCWQQPAIGLPPRPHQGEMGQGLCCRSSTLRLGYFPATALAYRADTPFQLMTLPPRKAAM